MRWLIPLLLIAAAGAGIWYVLDGGADAGYGPSEIRGGEGRGRPTRGPGMTAQGGARVGVFGQAPLPSGAAGVGEWMHAPLVWPEGRGRVTGKDLTGSLSAVVPVRFPTKGEMEAFQAHAFLEQAPEGAGDLGMLPTLLDGSGYVMEIKEGFILLRKALESEAPEDTDG